MAKRKYIYKSKTGDIELAYGKPFRTDNGTQFPGNYLQFATPADLNKQGIFVLTDDEAVQEIEPQRAIDQLKIHAHKKSVQLSSQPFKVVYEVEPFASFALNREIIKNIESEKFLIETGYLTSLLVRNDAGKYEGMNLDTINMILKVYYLYIVGIRGVQYRVDKLIDQRNIVTFKDIRDFPDWDEPWKEIELLNDFKKHRWSEAVDLAVQAYGVASSPKLTDYRKAINNSATMDELRSMSFKFD